MGRRAWLSSKQWIVISRIKHTSGQEGILRILWLLGLRISGRVAHREFIQTPIIAGLHHQFRIRWVFLILRYFLILELLFILIVLVNS